MDEQSRLSDAVRQSSDPLHLMQRVAEQALFLVPGAGGVFIALRGDDDLLTYVCGAGFLKQHVGLKLSVDGSLSGLAIRTGRVLRCDDTTTDQRVDGDACRAVGVLSTVCVPLMRGERSFGVLNVSSSQPRAFDSGDELVLGGLADFLSVAVASAADLERVTSALFAEWSPAQGSEFNAQSALDPDSTRRFVANVLSPHAAEQLAARERIERALEPGALSIVFQPVVDLESGQTHGVEALARFDEQPIRTPDAWFSEAHAVGLGLELELAAVELALTHQRRLPNEWVLAVNAGPRAMTSPALIQMLESADARRVVVELTEHVEVPDYPCLVRAISDVRATGARLAIDDTGAGVSSLAHILKLAPEFIKLDRALTTGIDRDPVRRALAGSLVTFAADTGPLIVAEGIETAGELSVLRQLGIRYGQGFYLGTPSPLPEDSLQPLSKKSVRI